MVAAGKSKPKQEKLGPPKGMEWVAKIARICHDEVGKKLAGLKRELDDPSNKLN